MDSMDAFGAEYLERSEDAPTFFGMGPRYICTADGRCHWGAILDM